MWPAREGHCAGFEELGLKRHSGSRSCRIGSQRCFGSVAAKASRDSGVGKTIGSVSEHNRRVLSCASK